MAIPFITCLCPTYKRPALLSNSLACFLGQDYPEEMRAMVMFDDAGQYDPHQGFGSWSLYTTSARIGTLPEKLNLMSTHFSASNDADIFVIWEDDDVYLPGHLSAIADEWVPGEKQFFVSENVLSNYDKPPGETQIEGAAGRFHASWAYSKELFGFVGGYPETDRLDFDQQMNRMCRDALVGRVTHYGDPQSPTYVYRWGNGVYHGSQRGEDGYRELWDELGRRPAPYVGELVPKMDHETTLLFERAKKPSEV